MATADGDMTGKVVPLAEAKRRRGRAKPCPICDKPSDVSYQPFCSKRCADIDLGRWLNEDYRLPTQEIDEDAIEALAAEAEQDPGLRDD